LRDEAKRAGRSVSAFQHPFRVNSTWLLGRAAPPATPPRLTDSAVFSPDEESIATAGDDRTACLWNVGPSTQHRLLRAGTPSNQPLPVLPARGPMAPRLEPQRRAATVGPRREEADPLVARWREEDPGRWPRDRRGVGGRHDRDPRDLDRTDAPPLPHESRR